MTEILGKSFYAVEMSRGVDLEDTTDPMKYEKLDSLILKKTESGQKRAMKKWALLNIKEPIKEMEDLKKRTESEQQFLNKHPEHLLNDKEEDEKEPEEKEEEENKEGDFWIMIEEYTVQEPKIWDCYQLFCKLINYKYNPYDDQELEEYLAMQEVNDQMKAEAIAGSSWPFAK